MFYAVDAAARDGTGARGYSSTVISHNGSKTLTGILRLGWGNNGGETSATIARLSTIK